MGPPACRAGLVDHCRFGSLHVHGRGGRMAYREVCVIEVREVLRGWLAGAGLRTVAAQAGVDRKTARRYVQAAEMAGVARNSDLGRLSDEVIGAVVAAGRPAPPAGYGAAGEMLEAQRE